MSSLRDIQNAAVIPQRAGYTGIRGRKTAQEDVAVNHGFIAASRGDACAVERALNPLHRAWIDAAFFSRLADAFARFQGSQDPLLDIDSYRGPAKAFALSTRPHKPGDETNYCKLRIEAIEPTTLTPAVAIARRVYEDRRKGH